MTSQNTFSADVSSTSSIVNNPLVKSWGGEQRKALEVLCDLASTHCLETSAYLELKSQIFPEGYMKLTPEAVRLYSEVKEMCDASMRNSATERPVERKAESVKTDADYQEELRRQQEFGNDEMFGTDLTGNNSGRYTISGLMDTMRSGFKNFGGNFAASFVSTLVGYAIGLAKTMCVGFFNALVSSRTKDVLYSMAVILILLVCHYLDLGHCVAGLLQIMMLAFAGNSILRVTLTSLAVLYEVRCVAANWQAIQSTTVVNANVGQKPRRIRGVFQAHELKDQVFERNATLFSALSKVICCFLAYSVMEVLPSHASFMTMVRKCKEIPQALRGILDMGTLVEAAFDNAFGSCFESCFGVGTMKANPIPKEVVECTSRIIELTSLTNLARIAKEPSLCAEADALYQQYGRFRIDYSNNREVINHLNTCAGSARDMFAQAKSTSPKANEARAKPPTLIIGGPSAVGKSVVTNYVVAGLLAKEGLITKEMTDQEIELRKGMCVYPRMVEQRFWDGYYGQLITIYDDFAQMRDSAAAPNPEFFELIRLTNMFPCPLHMAELSQKANTYFASKYIIGTTNDKNPFTIESLIHPQAVSTRVTMWATVKLDSRATREDGTIDPDKVLTHFGSLNSPEIYRFSVKEGDLVHEDVSVKELVTMVYNRRQANELNHDAMTENVGKFARGFFQGWFSDAVDPSQWREGYDIAYENVKARIAAQFQDIRTRLEKTNKWYNITNPFKVAAVLVAMALGGYMGYKHYTGMQREDWQLLDAKPKGHLFVFQKKDLYAVSAFCFPTSETVQWDYDELEEAVDASQSGKVVVIYGCADGSEQHVCFFRYGTIAGHMTVVSEGSSDLSTHLNEAAFRLLSLGAKGAGVIPEAKVAMFTETDAYLASEYSYAAQKAKEERAKSGFASTVESGRAKDARPRVVVEENALESGRSKDSRQRVVVEQEHQKVKVAESGRDKNMRQRVVIEGPSRGRELVRPGPAYVSMNPTSMAEAWASMASRECCVGPVKNAYWQVRTPDKDYLAPILAIGGKVYLVNTHYWDRIAPLERIFVTPFGSETGFELLVSEIEAVVHRIDGEETDLTILLLPKQTPPNVHLWRRFHSRADAVKLDNQVTVLVSPVNPDGVLERCTGKFLSMDTHPFDMMVPGGGVKTLCADRYIFDTRSYSGDCGGVYIIDDNAFEGRIIGFHFGGLDTGGAMAVPLFREHFKFMENHVEVVLPSYVKPSSEPLPFKGAVAQGMVDEPPGMNMRTSLIKSMFHGKVQRTTVAPAQLGYILQPDGAGLRGLQKVCGDVPHIDADDLDYAAESWKARAFNNGYPRKDRKKLTFEEAVQGVPGTKYIKPVNRVTSAGYPWCLKKKPGTKGKQGWLGFEEWDLTTPDALELRREVERLDEQLGRGVLEPSIFNDTLKDETRPIEKVLAGKTRVFSAAPMCGVVLVRQYCGRFVDAITNDRISNEICVGIQAHSTDWTRMVAHLASMGDNLVAGDFSDYDGSLNPAILKKIFQLMNEWYADEFSEQRMLLAENLCHSFHIAGPRVYRWTHSQPSGNPLTAILNSIYNSLVTRLAWIQMSRAQNFEERWPCAGFNQHVRMVSYGDDNLISVSAEVKEWFNMEELVDGYRKVGMKYTSEAKDGKVYTTKKLVECSFLKRGFRKWRSFWLAPLAQDSINESLNWCHKTANTRPIQEELARTQIAEWALHDSAKFNEMSDLIRAAVYSTMSRYVERVPQEQYIQTMLFGDYGVLFPMLCYA